MNEIPDFHDIDTLHKAWSEWGVENLKEYNAHVKNVRCPLPKEAINYRNEMIITTDAMSWTLDIMSVANDFKTQAMGIATENLTVAQAEKVCHRYIRVYEGLRTMYKIADRRLSSLQSLNKGG